MMPIPNRSTAANSQPANRINRFYLVREIGRGAVGTVYVARDPIIDRNVAIKTCNASLNPTEKKQAEQQLINEARAAGRLCHPNIVTIYEAGNDGATPYIAMEYLQGTDLSKFLRSGNKFSIEEVATVGTKLAEALAHAHKNGVIHRDINPGNIFMLGDNQPKIFDFGIARSPNRVQEDANDDEQFTLFRNNLLGTPNYMSPEQATGRQVDHLTDIYSLGAVMYEMLAHRKPFQSDSTEALLEAIAYKAPPAPHELNPNVPHGLSQIVVKAMSKRPEKRYQTALEMAQDIKRFIKQERQGQTKPAVKPATKPVEMEPVKQAKPAPAKPIKRSPLPTIALIVLLALAVGGYLWLR
jgi:serine/threonine-protein kinase